MFLVPTGFYSAKAVSSGSDPYFSNVTLLTNFNNNTFSDVKGHSISTSGSPVISTTQSLFGDKSVYLNGTDAALGISRNDVDLRSGSTPTWTIECWLYMLSDPSTRKIIFANYNFPGGAQSNTLFIGTNQIITNTSMSYALPQNQWCYFAATRDGGGIISVYSGGNLLTSGSGNPSDSATTNYIGGSPGDNNVGGEFFNGYIYDFRITENVVRSIVVPTSPFPNN